MHGPDQDPSAAAAVVSLVAATAASEKQQLNSRGFANIDVFTAGEENGHNWSWKVRTAVSGLDDDHDCQGVQKIRDENAALVEGKMPWPSLSFHEP